MPTEIEGRMGQEVKYRRFHIRPRAVLLHKSYELMSDISLPGFLSILLFVSNLQLHYAHCTYYICTQPTLAHTTHPQKSVVLILSIFLILIFYYIE